MMLIYPMTASFRTALPVFDYSDDLKLWVVPFDLDAGRLAFEFPASESVSTA